MWPPPHGDTRSAGTYASDVEGEQRESSVGLAELVAAFSLATDLGLGQPREHVLRSWLIAGRVGERLGLEAGRRESLYYVVTLAWVGCVAETPVVAALSGDDIAFRRDGLSVDRAGLPMLGFALRHIGAGSPVLHRLRLGADLMVSGGAAVEQGLLSHCLTTAQMAERLGLGGQVRDPLQHGKGVPSGVAGEGIAPPVRLFHLADCVEVVHQAGGVDAAVEVARARRGKQFDPAVVDVFCRAAGEVLADLEAVTDRNALIDGEPYLQQRLTGEELDTALEAIADFTDLRSPSRAGHSRAVAGLAARAAALCGLPENEVTTLRRAGLCMTSACMACPPRSSTSLARSPPPNRSGCGCTPTTPSGYWPAHPPLPASVPSPRWRTSGSTAPATTAACPGRLSRPPGGSSPRPTPSRP
jgi:hypothetical protein